MLSYTVFEPNWDEPELSVLKDHLTKLIDIKLRWKETDVKIVNFLQACKSLNEAVKLWPDVKMYLSKQDIDRMEVKREKVKESKALEALKQLDTDTLVSNVVIARMSGA